MLEYDPDKRISVEQAMNHKWIKENTITNQLDGNFINNLKNFDRSNHFRTAIKTFIGTQVMMNSEK